MRDEESRSRGPSLGGPPGADPPILNDAYRSSTSSAAAELQRQMNAQLMRMSTMSSFHGDNPFVGTPIVCVDLFVVLGNPLCFDVSVKRRLGHAVGARRRVPGHGGLAAGRVEVRLSPTILDVHQTAVLGRTVTHYCHVDPVCC